MTPKLALVLFASIITVTAAALRQSRKLAAKSPLVARVGDTGFLEVRANALSSPGWNQFAIDGAIRS